MKRWTQTVAAIISARCSPTTALSAECASLPWHCISKVELAGAAKSCKDIGGTAPLACLCATCSSWPSLSDSESEDCSARSSASVR
eukprot:3800090-Pyramimonas_sp.AAC.1